MLTYGELLGIYDCDCEDDALVWAQAERFEEWYGVVVVNERCYNGVLALMAYDEPAAVNGTWFPPHVESGLPLDAEVKVVFHDVEGCPEKGVGGWFKDVDEDGIESLVLYPED